jgi:hypothetical protein
MLMFHVSCFMLMFYPDIGMEQTGKDTDTDSEIGLIIISLRFSRKKDSKR